jgi:MerR family transcriptional regulator, thiopeptide resistance regulator
MTPLDPPLSRCGTCRRTGRSPGHKARTSLGRIERFAVTCGGSSETRAHLAFNPADYEDEARERWPEQFEQAQAVAPPASAEQVTAEQKEITAQLIRMAKLMTAGQPTADPEVQAEVDQDYRWVARHWTPTAQAYRNLGQLYVDDERFRARYEQIAPGLAAYQRDAMTVYARDRLS